MTPPAAPDPTSDRRTVGDILLTRGYVTQAQLDHALASQQRTGKPLGQVLVEAGAITRLELASALAEQWSDTASWLGPPDGAPARPATTFDAAGPHEAHEAGFAQQLQEAVVELARRVAGFEPALTDLRLRVEAGAAGAAHGDGERVDAVESALSTIWRRLDELTDGIEQALNGLEQRTDVVASGVAELRTELERAPVAADVAALRSAVDALAGDAAPADDVARLESALTAAVAELATRVDGLAARPVPDATVAARVAELEARLDAPADTTQLDVLARRLDAVETANAAAAALATRVDDLAGRVEGLSAIGSSDDGEGLAELAATVGSLAARLDSLADRASLDELRARLDEVAARSTGTELLDQLGELAGRIERLAEDAGTGVDPQAVEDLRATVAELAERPQPEPLDEGLLHELAARLDGVAARVEALGEHPAEPDAAALAELRAAVDELAARPAGDPALAERVEELAVRVTDQADVLSALPRDANAGLRGDLAEVIARLALLDDVADRVSRLEQRPEPVLETTADADAFAAVAQDLHARLDALARDTAATGEAWAAARTALEARIDELAARPAGEQAVGRAMPPTASAAAADAPPEAELERLRMAIERINLHLGERERAIADLIRSRSEEPKVDELAARIAELERSGVAPAAADGGPPDAASAGLHVELRRLAQRVEEAENAARADREKVLTQLERMASSIDWRFRRLETGEEGAAA